MSKRFLKNTYQKYFCRKSVRGCAFHFVEIFHFVENAVCNLFIFSYCTAEFLNKFSSSESGFNRNILTSLYLKSECLRMRNYAVTCLYILYTSFTTWRQLETYIEDTIDKWHQ